MAPRDRTAVVQLKTRLREPLRARLEAGAKRRGVTLNTEIVDRLEQSFAKEDAFDGPEMLNMARLMAAAFIRGGQQGAHARQHPEWTPSEWVHDKICYQTAVRAVMKALAAAQPELDDPDQKTFVDLFAAELARREATFAEPKSLRRSHQKKRKETKSNTK